MPRLCEVYPGICLTTEEKAPKNLVYECNSVNTVVFTYISALVGFLRKIVISLHGYEREKKLAEVRRCFGMEMNVEKTKIMRISTQSSPVQIMMDKKVENVEYFNCSGSMMTCDARRTPKIKCSIVMAKAALNKEKTLYISKLDLNLRREVGKCYIWNAAVCGSETWTFRKGDQNYLESFEIWCCSWMENISWTDRVGN